SANTVIILSCFCKCLVSDFKLYTICLSSFFFIHSPPLLFPISLSNKLTAFLKDRLISVFMVVKLYNKLMLEFNRHATFFCVCYWSKLKCKQIWFACFCIFKMSFHFLVIN